MKVLLTIFLFCLPLTAQDARLAALRRTIMAMREAPDVSRETRGATPELTVAKHQVRDWVEGHLTKFAKDGDEAALAQTIHDEIRDAQLFCTDFYIECYPSNRGFLDEVRINRDQEFLIIRTAVGIWCGYDYSAYVYRWNNTGWQRIWANEQNTYTEKSYRPQILHAVQISMPDAGGNRLLLTLGAQPGCSGGFQPVYYRVFPMNARYQVQRAVLDANEYLNVAFDPPIEGRIEPDDLLLEINVGGTGYGESHRALRHFEIRNGRARQVDPIARTPRDFVEEWLAAPWSQSVTRAESPDLRQWHVKLHRDDGQGTYPDPAMRCTSSAELWQVGLRWHEGPKTYYLVRWKEPWHFTMVGISDRAYPDCTVTDPKGDDHPPLFNP